ncbi:effector-associated domain 2-containing protein [Microbispora bryophytorum]|uniref:VMAP-C domain-containing protein n=1 Tax=Microbispora bryophytorum TaxID=1460882 RepID=UPI0033C0935A
MPEQVGPTAVVEALWKIVGMRPEVINDVLTTLPGFENLSVPASPIPKVHLLNIVKVCVATEEGRQALFRSVSFFAGDSPHLEHVKRLVGLADDYLEPAEESAIKDLLERCEVPGMRSLFRQATRGRSLLYPPEPTSAWELYDLLLDSNSGKQLEPHLIFVSLLHARMVTQDQRDSVLAAELRRWLYGQRDRLRAGGRHEAATELEQRVRGELPFALRDDQPRCLIIEIDPLPVVDAGGDLHRISHWTHDHPMAWDPVRGDEVALPFGRVEDYVVELVLRTEAEWTPGSGDTLVLEFMLPPDLVNLGVEQWARRIDGLSEPRALGLDYEVVLRGDGRLRPAHRRPLLAERWHRLLSGKCATHQFPPSGASLEAIRNTLAADGALVACMLSEPPDSPEGRAQLAVAIDAGIPIVIWCRDSSLNEKFRTDVQDLVQPSRLAELPRRLKELRRSIPSCGNVALLWDDPRRPIPEPPKLRSTA